jgi:hypothetical protein
LQVPNGNYRHLKGTVPDLHCGAVFSARGTTTDHAPLTCMVFDPMVQPQFGDFYVTADYRFCPLAGF